MKIISATEAIPVERPIFLLVGQPGICKTSLSYSAPKPILLDFDKGAHRATNRGDTLVIDTWKDVVELMESDDALDAYESVVVDTVGRCLDVMTAHIATTDPKKAPGGTLSQQGWGVLKTMFRNWMSALRAKGKHVILLAHDKEDKDGDVRVVRADIAGGSYGEVMKVADFVGYLYLSGKDRVLDFNPTDRYVGKNPARWKPFQVPPPAKATTFMTELLERGSKALGEISEASATVVAEVAQWRSKVENATTLDECTALAVEMGKLPAGVVAMQAKTLLLQHAEAKGWHYDKGAKKFVGEE